MTSRLVFYPGHHGPEAVARHRDPNRATRFKAGQVRMMRDPEGADLIRLGGYQEALTVEAAAARAGLTAKHVRQLAKDGEISSAELAVEGEGKPELVVVLDDRTRRRLHAPGAPAPAATEPTPEEV